MTSSVLGASLLRLVPSLAVVMFACQSAPPEPAAKKEEPAKAATAALTAPPPPAETAPAAPKPARTSAAKVSPDDPLHGNFSLADATAELPGTGALSATIETDLGKLECKLLDDKAPVTVANFIGLARGIRPWKDASGSWVKKPAYDGTIFHRIIKGFMIQGGDSLGNGSGEPGYVVEDEIWPGAVHNRAGLLCMANRGPNTNGAQFFITDASAPHLDRSYTIFGECAPVDMVHKLASVPVEGEKPQSPPKIKSVKIHHVGK